MAFYFMTSRGSQVFSHGTFTKDDPESLVEEIEMLEDIDSSEDSDSPLPVWDDSNCGRKSRDHLLREKKIF